MAEKLAVLQIELTNNTSDTALAENIKATKDRGLPLVGVGDIQSQPLILCGSGPSLDKYFPMVRAAWPDAPVMALNGAYRHLVERHGIIPAYYAQLDARRVNTNFLYGLPDHVLNKTEFLLASQVHPSMFELAPRDRTRVFHLNTPSAKAQFPDEGLYFGSRGGTIGSTAIALAAVSLGFRTIILVGYDSSYDKGRSHAPDQPQNEGIKTLPVFVEDREYETTPAMAKQVEQFRPFLKDLTDLIPELDVRLCGEGLFYDFIITGDKAPARSREEEASLYAEMYHDPHYGMPEFRRDRVKELLILNHRGDQPKSLLDVGTGRGETIRLAAQIGYTPVAGTETVDELIKADERIGYGLLPNISAPTGYYDIVTCFEVIEHLRPDDVIPALEELARLAKQKVIISVCTAPDIRGGVNLHPSYRTEDQWIETFKVAWGDDARIAKVGQFSNHGVSPVFEYSK